MELEAIENTLVSEITTDVTKKNKSWQIVVVVFFETFGKKDEPMKASTHITCSINEKNITSSTMTHLQIKNNKANATIVLDVPFVSMSTFNVLSALYTVDN